MEHRSKSEIREARRAAMALEADARALLWRRLRDGVRSDDLAAAADDHEETLSRMTGGSCRFRLSTLVALCHLDPDGGRELLDLVVADLGLELRPVLQAVPALSDSDAASQLGERSGHIAMLLCRFLGDGKIDDTEAAELEQVLPKLRWALARAEASFEIRRATR